MMPRTCCGIKGGARFTNCVISWENGKENDVVPSRHLTPRGLLTPDSEQVMMKGYAKGEILFIHGGLAAPRGDEPWFRVLSIGISTLNPKP
jgi:hypothetical protein